MPSGLYLGDSRACQVDKDEQSQQERRKAFGRLDGNQQFCFSTAKVQTKTFWLLNKKSQFDLRVRFTKYSQKMWIKAWFVEILWKPSWGVLGWSCRQWGVYKIW